MVGRRLALPFCVSASELSALFIYLTITPRYIYVTVFNTETAFRAQGLLLRGEVEAGWLACVC